MMRTRWIRNTLFGFDWASDGKWDWTSDVGDKHSDFASLSVCRRDGYPPVYRVTLGPICLSMTVGRGGDEGARGY